MKKYPTQIHGDWDAINVCLLFSLIDYDHFKLVTIEWDSSH
jgi:hypothetical protein